MINLNELIHDPDFNCQYRVRRETRGKWVKGRYENETSEFTVTGIVAPSSSKDLEMIPEGDRETGMKTFYTDIPLYTTGKGSISDECLFRGTVYKLLQVFDYSSNGYYKAIGTVKEDSDDL